jgi:putative endonuclease
MARPADGFVMKPPAKQWCVYVLRCSDRSLYCGISNDLQRRIKQHNCGKGARYTRSRGPVKLARSWPVENKSAALKAELAFKKLKRPAKIALLKRRGKPALFATVKAAGRES